MKRTIHFPYWLILLIVLAFAISACERPVPGADDNGDADGAVPTTDAEIVIPTSPPVQTTEAYPPPEGGEGQPTADPNQPAPTAAPEQPAPTADPNQPAPTAVPPTATPAPVGEATTHTVQPGDTLYSLSKLYGVTVEEIMVANALSDPSTLYVGQVLTIPAPGAAQPPAGEQTHVVQRGENLFRIGLRYGFTVNEMAAYNNLTYPYTIYPGQILRIPPSG